MPDSLQNDEASFIAGVGGDGTIPAKAYYGWDGSSNPATYTSGYTDSRKWGSDAAGSTATVTYYLDPHFGWTTAETQAFTAGLALWAAVANVTFTPTTAADGANITIVRGTDGKAYTTTSATDQSGSGGVVGSRHLLALTGATISISTDTAGFGPIDGTFSAGGGSPLLTILHEEGHALGLGHAGPYDDTVNPASQQNGPYDTMQWSAMSYITPSGASWNGNVPTTWMPLDILAIQRLYGVATTTPLSGGQTFGFNSNVSGNIAPFFDFTKNATPVVTLWDKGTGNTLDLSGFSAPETVNLNAGTFSSVDGMTNNLGIAFNTSIDTLVCGTGGSTITCNDDGDTVIASSGNNTITGGAGVDNFTLGPGTDQIDGGANVNTVVLSGAKSAYSINQTATGTFTVSGNGSTDTLTNVEYIKFSDQTQHLLPGTGTVVNWSTDPSTYMSAIRDFDGNNLGAALGWKLVGTADVTGTGAQAHILFNSQIGRWAELGTEADGKTYFDNHGWAGDTRVVGTYIDPLVANGTVQAGSDVDSQRRFQNDLQIGNISGILGEGDYNHDGLQEVYFSLTDGTAYLHAYMHADGNIQYANYQSKRQHPICQLSVEAAGDRLPDKQWLELFDLGRHNWLIPTERRGRRKSGRFAAFSRSPRSPAPRQ